MQISSFDQNVLDNIVKDPCLPYRDGAGREPLPAIGWSQNLKASAPWVLRANFAAYKSGATRAPIGVILTAPTSESQYWALMDFYRLIGVDRPAIKKKNIVSSQEKARWIELRKGGMSTRDIAALTGRSHQVVSEHTKHLKYPETPKKLLNRLSLRIYGIYFLQLGMTRRKHIVNFASREMSAQDSSSKKCSL